MSRFNCHVCSDVGFTEYVVDGGIRERTAMTICSCGNGSRIRAFLTAIANDAPLNVLEWPTRERVIGPVTIESME